MFFFVRKWSFYEKHHIDPDSEDVETKCFENTSVCFIANFQYLVVCMVYSISKPFRQPLYTNKWLTISLAALFIFSTYIVLSPDSFITDLLELESRVSSEFRLATIVAVVLNSIVTYGFERIVVWKISIWEKNKTDRKIAKEQLKEIQDQQAIM